MLNDKGEEVGIIYGWYNTKSEKWYIGQTIRPLERFKDHIDASINKKDNTKFHNALRKYGLDKFVYCVLEENVLRANLNLKEIEWIEYYDSFYNGYNMSAGGGQTIFSEEVKRKLSESHKGQHSCWKGKHLPKKTREKISNTLKGHIGPQGPKNPMYGKPALNRRKVSKYDLEGNFIKTYNSITEAKTQNNKCTGIISVCRGYRRQAGGFIWKYA